MGVVQGAAADEPRWVTFRTVHNNWGEVQHQIDRQTIRQEGGIRTFWTRMWRAQKKEPLVVTFDEQLVFWSQKFAVDCPGQRFGRDFVDTNFPSERKRKASLSTLRWVSLEKFPQVARTVCAK
jgi:hypothetical protein